MNAPVQIDTVLAEHAVEIRRIGRRVISDIIEIGRRLTEAKELCGHGNWLPWLEREFKWNEKTATSFMRVFDMSKSVNFTDLSLPISGLYLLAAPSTPEEARDAIIEKAKPGEAISVKTIRDTIARSYSGHQPNDQGDDGRGESSSTEDAGDEDDQGEGSDGEGGDSATGHHGGDEGEGDVARKPPTRPAAASSPTSSVAAKAEATAPEREARARAAQDVGADSAAEAERLRVRVEELQNEVQRLTKQNIGLQSEICDLTEKLVGTVLRPVGDDDDPLLTYERALIKLHTLFKQAYRLCKEEDDERKTKRLKGAIRGVLAAGLGLRELAQKPSQSSPTYPSPDSGEPHPLDIPPSLRRVHPTTDQLPKKETICA